MKRQVIDPSRANHLDMENMKTMMEMSSLLQKLDKGRRKYEIKLNFASRQLLATTLSEMKKAISSMGELPKNFENFVAHVEASKKAKVVPLSYDEINFLRKVVILALEQQKSIRIPWYRFLTMIFSKMASYQYKEILNALRV